MRSGRLFGPVVSSRDFRREFRPDPVDRAEQAGTARDSEAPEALVAQGGAAYRGTGRDEVLLSHNPKVAGSNPAPATIERPESGPSRVIRGGPFRCWGRSSTAISTNESLIIRNQLDQKAGDCLAFGIYWFSWPLPLLSSVAVRLGPRSREETRLSAMTHRLTGPQ